MLTHFLKDVLEERIQGIAFLESGSLDSLEVLGKIVSEQTQVIAVLLLRSSLTHMWCALQLAALTCNKVPIVLIVCNDCIPIDDDFMNNLDNLWTSVQRMGMAQQGCELEHVKTVFEHIRAGVHPVVELDRFAPSKISSSLSIKLWNIKWRLV